MGIGASQDLCAVRAPGAAGVAAGRPGAEEWQRMSAAARALRSPPIADSPPVSSGHFPG